jgi:lysophospholipase L1-like esterase
MVVNPCRKIIAKGFFPYVYFMISAIRPFILLLFIFSSAAVLAQKPFEEEIIAFRQEDSLRFPGKNKILFLGSSSIRLWADLQNDFPDRPIINRGFGGSTFEDVLLFKDDLLKPYQPRQVVIYCGENDLAGGAEPQKVYDNFRSLFSYIRRLSPKTHVLFISIKPSPSRKHIFEKVKETNSMIRSFLEKQQRAAFVDIFTPMLNPDGTFREELFVEDRLHMNRKGYDIWKKAIKPYLK